MSATAQDAHEVRIQRQERHHHHQRQHARHHQEFHGREAQRGQGIDFFVHRHRAQPRRKGGPGPAGHDDGGHHRPHLQRHRHAHQIGHIDLRPEHGELDRPDEGQDGPHQKRDQGDDRQGLGAALLDEHRELDPAEAGPAAQELPQGEHGFADEAEHVTHRRDQAKRLLADAVEEGLSDGLPPRPLALRHGGGEVQQPSQPLGQPLLVHHDLALRPEVP